MLDCVICLRETTSLTTLSCTHSFCEDCISCWLSVSNKCPLCTQIVSEASPIYQHEAEQISPCVDYSNDIQYLERRLSDVKKRVNTKQVSSQNIKSTVSKMDAEYYLAEYREAEQLFYVFTLLVSENTNNGQVVHLLETINFKLLDLQNMLEGGVKKSKVDQYKQICESDYDDDFPELGSGYQKLEKQLSKCHKNKIKSKNSIK